MQLEKEQYGYFLDNALYPCVRVRTQQAGGSGQVVHSSEQNGTFVLTCEHVVDKAITTKKEWSPVLQRDVKKDVREEVEVEFFKYSYKDRAVGSEAIKAEIVAYDKTEDIALLRLKAGEVRGHVAKMMSVENIEDSLDYFDEVVTIGCALGHPPIATLGNVCSFNDIIDNRDYMQSTAPSIFGNSGGATFLTKTWTLIGMPARISVQMSGFAADAITHLGYIVPFWRIHQFYNDQMMYFMTSEHYTYAQCLEMVRKKREKLEMESIVREGQGEDLEE